MIREAVSFADIIQDGIDESHIMNIFVDKSHRNKGIGKILLKKLINIAKNDKILLEVEESNTTAIKLYKAFGFKEISRRNKYFKEKTAIIMEYNR